jgi:hypothetical protein
MQAGTQVEAQLDLAAQGAHQHLGKIEDQVVDVDWPGLQALFACEGQQLLGELAGAHSRALGALELLAGQLGPVEADERDFEVAVDDLQQVVEVVRHAGRQLADRLHLLRLQVGFLRGAALRDVHLRGEEIQQLAVLVEDRAQEQGIPEDLAVLFIIEDVDPHRALFRDRMAQLVHRAAVGLRSLQEAAVAAHRFLIRIAGEVEEGAVGEHDGIVGLARIGDDHRHARHLDGGEEDVAAVLQAVLGYEAGLPVLDPGVAERAVGVALDFAIGRHAAAVAVGLVLSLLVERFFEPLILGASGHHRASSSSICQRRF